MLGEVTFPEVQGSLKHLSIGVGQHIYHFHVVCPNEVLGNDFRGNLLSCFGVGWFVDVGCGSCNDVWSICDPEREGRIETGKWAGPQFACYVPAKWWPSDGDWGDQANWWGGVGVLGHCCRFSFHFEP